LTENDWLSSNNFEALLTHAAEVTSARKLHLFACACCRQLALNSGEWEALEAAEVLADGMLAGEPITARRLWEEKKLLEALRPPMRRRGNGALHPENQDGWTWCAIASVLEDFSQLKRAEILHRVRAIAEDARLARYWGQTVFPEHEPPITQLSLLRDIVGNPFRPVPIQPEWLFWQDRLIPQLARAMYAERRFAELPVLADALEDAGCDEQAILGHLRAPAVHVRGCWAVDLLVGMW
jgi:hypothetical protein